MRVGLGSVWNRYKPHMVMIMAELSLAIFMIMVQFLVSKATINSLVLVVYQQTVSTFLLSILAFFIEKGKRPPLSFPIVCYSFLLGLQMITFGQMVLIVSLRYVPANYQSIALNLETMVVFVFAVVFRHEKLQFGDVHGQAKIWGVVVSVTGALITVLWQGPTIFKYGLTRGSTNSIIGGAMLALGVLSLASWNLLVGNVSRKYPAYITLMAMMSFFGTIQTAVITGLLVRWSSWKLEWEGGLVLVAILWGGIFVAGLSYYAQSWCIHKKGPVFTTAFYPLLVVFSFLLEAIILRKSTHLGSIIGAISVVVGLYLLLWGKAKDGDECKETLENDEEIISPLIPS